LAVRAGAVAPVVPPAQVDPAVAVAALPEVRLPEVVALVLQAVLVVHQAAVRRAVPAAEVSQVLLLPVARTPVLLRLLPLRRPHQ
jgi:hypothetical protein